MSVSVSVTVSVSVSGVCRVCVTCVSVVCQPCVAVWEEGEEEEADRSALGQLIFEGYVSALAPVMANNVAQQRVFTDNFTRMGRFCYRVLLKIQVLAMCHGTACCKYQYLLTRGKLVFHFYTDKWVCVTERVTVMS